ncbi:MAG: hypothetical protein QOJ07_1227 [Thermoleophilaceae bacterium]|jgi:uncharacterized protein YbjT (DUF2867 family)|nr:hypothetical protein [Thermoleophilaceae bacterium]
MTLGLTGATGGIGSRVAARLAEEHLPLRLIARDPARAPDVPGAEVARAEYRDIDAMRAALAGVETLFLVSGGESADRVDEHFAAVDAAADAGVGRIVYLSFLGAAPGSTFTFARDHFHTEERIGASGMRHTFLRDSMYADYVPVFATADGVIQGPAGNGRVSWVARDDVADVAAAVLLDPDKHDDKTYDVTGPEALTMTETATLLSEVSGARVVYREETIEEARESRAPSGAPDWEIEGWVTSYAAIAAGELETVSDAVERITGHAPEALGDWLRRHPETWAHLAG